jgi:hypothetical protein
MHFGSLEGDAGMTPPPADLLPDFLHAIEPIAARPGPYGTTVSITPNEARALVEILRRPHPIAGDGWNEAIGRAAETAYCCTSVDDAVTAIRALRRPAPQPPAGELRKHARKLAKNLGINDRQALLKMTVDARENYDRADTVAAYNTFKDIYDLLHAALQSPAAARDEAMVEKVAEAIWASMNHPALKGLVYADILDEYKEQWREVARAALATITGREG